MAELKVFKVERERWKEWGPRPKPLVYKVREGDCWEPLNLVVVQGTPMIHDQGLFLSARRWMYARVKGWKVDPKVSLYASCGHPWCINPDHVVEKAKEAENGKGQSTE